MFLWSVLDSGALCVELSGSGFPGYSQPACAVSLHLLLHMHPPLAVVGCGDFEAAGMRLCAWDPVVTLGWVAGFRVFGYKQCWLLFGLSISGASHPHIVAWNNNHFIAQEFGLGLLSL